MSWARDARGKYVEHHGPAYVKGGTYCKHKLCFATTDLDALIALLEELGEREDCFYAKYSTEPHAGMFLGRLFLTDEDAVGALWQQYKQRAPFYCTVQDDAWTLRFRPGFGDEGCEG